MANSDGTHGLRTYLLELLRALLLVNGGAVVGLLTFYGNLVTNPKAPPAAAASLATAMMFFSGGLLSGLLLALFAAFASRYEGFDPSTRVERAELAASTIGAWVSATAGVVCFAIGAWLAAGHRRTRLKPVSHLGSQSR